ncbi:MAG: CPBP family intramembrane metalloprotease [Candidatus Omnitrophota bacterium]|nr:MAG: CPBP family intramembrane metalloprotease [Candidatus Omnitrophota bacterium]
MSINFNISRIRAFINKEKLYMFLLSFILLFNAMIIFSERLPPFSARGGSAFGGKESAPETILEAPEEIDWTKVLQEHKQVPVIISIFGFLALFAFSLGLFLDIRILMAKIKKRDILKEFSPHLGINWRVWDIFRLAIIFASLGYALQIVEANLLSFASDEEGALKLIPLLNAGIMDLALLGFIIYFVKVKYRQSLEVVGLKIKGAIRGVFLALFSYIAFLPVFAFLLLLLILAAKLFNYHPPQQEVFKVFLQENRLWFLIYSTAMVVILGPIVEEIFFRGFAYNALKKRWGVPWAMSLTALVFAGLHANLFGFLPIAALGFLLAYVYEKTGSLIPSIAIHMLHNSLMVLMLFMGRYFMGLGQ